MVINEMDKFVNKKASLVNGLSLGILEKSNVLESN